MYGWGVLDGGQEGRTEYKCRCDENNKIDEWIK